MNFMPGAFPTDTQPSMAQATRTLDLSLEAAFERKEAVGTKSVLQRHLVGQLEALCYLLIVYQFIKHCHCACLFPIAAHWLVQLQLDFNGVMMPGSGRLLIFAEALALQEQQAAAIGAPFDRSSVINYWLGRVCLIIYWKFIAVVVYHVLFIVYWIQPIADNGRLGVLVNGAWYCTSFIGESVPENYSASSPWWIKLWQLGLPHLLLTDLLILALQLVLYQAVFIQSTLSPRGQLLEEDEVYILRAKPGGQAEVVCDAEGIPEILHVKLYEALSTKAYAAD